MNTLPFDIQQDWQAQLHKAIPTEKGYYELIAIRRTNPKDFESQRITVLVLDENDHPKAGIKVAFAYSTADFFPLTPDFLWIPPAPQQAFIVPTTGAGQIDQIQGSVVKQGQPGGVTVYIFEPEYSSDIVTGCGMLADHTGLHLTFQLKRVGVKSFEERLTDLESRVMGLENG